MAALTVVIGTTDRETETQTTILLQAEGVSNIAQKRGFKCPATCLPLLIESRNTLVL